MDRSATAAAAPSAVLSDLASHVLKTVTVAGTVVDAADPQCIRLEDHEKATVVVNRPAGAPLVVEAGMKVLVRGVVNQDLSIAEAPTFPTTDLGDKFDVALHNEAARVLSQAAVASIFS
jgi:hypothetical protein